MSESRDYMAGFLAGYDAALEDTDGHTYAANDLRIKFKKELGIELNPKELEWDRNVRVTVEVLED